jgi:hypothetical protein
MKNAERLNEELRTSAPSISKFFIQRSAFFIHTRVR